MFRNVVLLLVIFALAASAATYKVTLTQTSMLKGNELKAGEYRLNLEASKVTITSGKQSLEVPVKVENSDQKFDNTAVRYTGGDKPKITEIRIGGTKTKLVFNE